MKTNLLKIKNMKKFCEWLEMSGYGTEAPIFEGMSAELIEKIFKHQSKLHNRDIWCYKNDYGVVSYERYSHARRLIHYVLNRKERIKKKG
jgi:hypothetical protein